MPGLGQSTYTVVGLTPPTLYYVNFTLVIDPRRPVWHPEVAGVWTTKRPKDE